MIFQFDSTHAHKFLFLEGGGHFEYALMYATYQ